MSLTKCSKSDFRLLNTRWKGWVGQRGPTCMHKPKFKGSRYESQKWLQILAFYTKKGTFLSKYCQVLINVTARCPISNPKPTIKMYLWSFKTQPPEAPWPLQNCLSYVHIVTSNDHQEYKESILKRNITHHSWAINRECTGLHNISVPI